MPIKKGDKVKVEYTGKLDDGTVFDSTEKQGGEPLEFEVGGGQIIPGFDKAVMGMEKGEEKEVHIKSSDAYGEHKEEMVKQLPNQGLPKEAKVGSVLGINLPTGQQVPAKVVKIDEKTVTIDLNHPLAGKDLTFHLKVVDYNS
jgi:FKBP-type peptidyl-prolyl cis-trans isomerase 2